MSSKQININKIGYMVIFTMKSLEQIHHLTLSVSMASLQPQRSSRSKRGLLELAGVIKCSTGRSALTYAMYGCYCGLGGQGWPRDRADW